MIKSQILFLTYFLFLSYSQTCSDSTYYYNNNLSTCILCGFGCSECCDENVCFTCSAGFVLSTKGTCLECP